MPLSRRPPGTRTVRERSITRRYCVIFEQSPEGMLVSVPALPGCLSFGASRTEAEAGIRDAAALYLGAGLADGEPLPDSERVRPMIASPGCRAAFMTFSAPLSAHARRNGRMPASPVTGYDVRAVTRGHILIRRPFDRRKIVIPRLRRAMPGIVQRMMNRVLIGDRSFHVPFYQIGSSGSP